MIWIVIWWIGSSFADNHHHRERKIMSRVRLSRRWQCKWAEVGWSLTRWKSSSSTSSSSWWESSSVCLIHLSSIMFSFQKLFENNRKHTTVCERYQVRIYCAIACHWLLWSGQKVPSRKSSCIWIPFILLEKITQTTRRWNQSKEFDFVLYKFQVFW